MEQHLIAPEPHETFDPALPSTALSADGRRAAIAHHMAALEELADPSPRGDGWTSFARKLFLQTLAETGRVTVACDYARLSKQSAYALRARDPVFAAGWDAACELARMPLADALYEAALDGQTETITRDDGRTMTRHRFDSRLSIAVLNRLDRRCDRAAEQGSRHVGAVAQWEAFTAAVGRDDQAAAKAILDPPEPTKPSQASQLRDYDDEEEAIDDGIEERVWWDEDRDEWRTSFPPPQGFDGQSKALPGHFGYSRTLTEEEQLLIDYDIATGEIERLAAETKARDTYFNALRAEVAAARKSSRHGLEAESVVLSETSPGAGTRMTAANEAAEAATLHPGLEPGSTILSEEHGKKVDPGSEAGVTQMDTPSPAGETAAASGLRVPPATPSAEEPNPI